MRRRTAHEKGPSSKWIQEVVFWDLPKEGENSWPPNDRTKDEGVYPVSIIHVAGVSECLQHVFWAHNVASYDKPFNTLRSPLVIKNAAFRNLITRTKPDIVFGTESWLTPDIHNSEIFPSGYNAYRKDRKRGIKKCEVGFPHDLHEVHQCAAPQLNTDCEITWAQVQLPGLRFLNVGSFNHPDYNVHWWGILG